MEGRCSWYFTESAYIRRSPRWKHVSSKVWFVVCKCVNMNNLHFVYISPLTCVSVLHFYQITQPFILEWTFTESSEKFSLFTIPQRHCRAGQYQPKIMPWFLLHESNTWQVDDHNNEHPIMGNFSFVFYPKLQTNSNVLLIVQNHWQHVQVVKTVYTFKYHVF